MMHASLPFRGCPFFGLVTAMLCWLLASGKVHAEEFLVLRVENGSRSILRYDRLELSSRAVRKINPNWTTEQGLSRPFDVSKVASVNCVDYDRADAKGRLGIPMSMITKIRLWESLAMEDVQLCLTQHHDDDARYLLAEIEKANPKWEPEKRLLILQQLRLKQAMRQWIDDKSSKNFELGLATLEDLRREAPALPGLGTSFESLLLPLAEKYYDERRYAECHDFVSRILTADATMEKTKQLVARMRKDAESLLSKAETAVSEKRGRMATMLAFKALQIQPQDAAIKRRVTAIVNLHQALSVACYENAVALDPFNARQLLEKQLVPLLFDCLVEANEEGLGFYNGPLVKHSKAVPGFRRVANGSHAIEYTFELRRDLQYSDGTTITSADVAGTVRALQDPSTAAYDSELARLLIDVEVTSPFQFSLLTRQHPYPESFFNFPIVPERFCVRIPKRNDPLSRKPIGSGPFVIAAMADPTNPLRLESNPKFRSAGQPYIQEITFPRYQKKGEGHAEDDLLQRRIHMISDPSPMQLVRLQNASQEFRTRPLLSNSVWVLAINHRKPLLMQRDLRRAILLAIDREAILKRWFSSGQTGGSHGNTLVAGPFPPHAPANDPAIKVPSAQPVVAKTLLGKVMPSDSPTTFTLKFPQTDLTIELAINQMKRDLEAAGFKIRLDPKLPNDMMHEVAELHDFDLAYWRIDHDNILFNMAALFDPSEKAIAPGGSNFFGYAPQKLTQLFVDLRNEQVGDRIWNIQHHIHRLLVDEVVMIPLWKLDNHVVYTSRLRGQSLDGKAVDLPINRTTVFRRTEDWWLEPLQ